MIETLEGLKNAEGIAKVPGVTAVFAASGDLGNFSGYRQGSPDYERAINIVHDAALRANVRPCGPLAWRDRPALTCFQARSETAAIARAVAAARSPSSVFVSTITCQRSPNAAAGILNGSGSWWALNSSRKLSSRTWLPSSSSSRSASPFRTTASDLASPDCQSCSDICSPSG